MESAQGAVRGLPAPEADRAGPAVATTLVAQGDGWDLRQVAATAGAVHGPRRADVDACVVVLSGAVVFRVDGQSHTLHDHGALFVPAGALRAFVAGASGVRFLALHLPPPAAAGQGRAGGMPS